MNIIYMGTPEFSVKPLQALYDAGHKIVGVVCQPDKINSRGNKIDFCPTKKWAINANVPVFQFEKLKEVNLDSLIALNADVIITCAYGKILPQTIIDMCKYGVINIHSSLLPKYRGASPVSACLLGGDDITGITIMQTNIGMDDGDIFYQESIVVEKEDNSITLANKLSELGAKCIVKVLANFTFYRQNALKQDESKVSFSKKISKQYAKINFNNSAENIIRAIKAYALNPTSFFIYNDKRFKVYNAQSSDFKVTSIAKSGEILASDKINGLVIACGDNKAISITQIQAPNGKVLNIKNFLNGNKFFVGEVCE